MLSLSLTKVGKSFRFSKKPDWNDNMTTSTSHNRKARWQQTQQRCRPGWAGRGCPHFIAEQSGEERSSQPTPAKQSKGPSAFLQKSLLSWIMTVQTHTLPDPKPTHVFSTHKFVISK